MTNTVYPIGYSGNGAQERIDVLLSYPKTLLIDTRFKPTSWSERWRKEELMNTYGEKYRLAGKYLGNQNYQGGPIQLADPDTGIRGLLKYLSEGHDLVLLCQCREFSKCHMNTICTMLLERMPEVEVALYEPSSLGPCGVCGEPGTLRSPSGNPESVYCSKHGYCARRGCGRSIKSFVLHPRMKIWCCPCIIKFEEQFELREK